MLTIPTKRLAEAVKAVGALATMKHIPILSCVRMSATGGVLTLDGTDMDAWLTVEVAGVEGELPATCVDAQKLRSALAVGGSGELTLKLGEMLSIKGDGGRATLPALDAREYPQPQEIGGATLALAVPSAELRSAIAAVLPCVSTEASWQWLCGAALWVDRQGGRLSATDGRLLMQTRLPGAVIAKRDDAVIIPTAAMQMLPPNGGDITIRTDGQKIEFKADGWRLVSRLIDHKPIEMDRIVPERGDCWADVDAAELIAAVERVAWASDLKRAAVLLEIREGEIAIEAWGGNGVDASAVIPADARLGGAPAPEIGIYAHVLLPVLRGMGSEVVGISWAKNNQLAPLRIDAVGPNDGQRWGVAMPCALRKPQEMKHAA